MHTADNVMELLAALRQQTDLSAEFFLLCLEVRQTMCALAAGFVWQ